MRRLRFIVNFPFPGPAERQAIWEGVYPKPDEKGELPGLRSKRRITNTWHGST